jgi:uncharacterized protein with FMN-binding domain
VGNLALTFAFGAAILPWTPPPDAVAPAPLAGQVARLPVSETIPVAVSYKDGTYVGPAVNAYWGDVQVQAVVQNGQISGLSVLKYPSDRRESLRISQQALPLLRNEVVKAQVARVNVITGATLTSEAFMRSLEGALAQGGGPAPQSPATPNAPARPGQRTPDNSLRI